MRHSERPQLVSGDILFPDVVFDAAFAAPDNPPRRLSENSPTYRYAFYAARFLFLGSHRIAEH